jgi:hypothetical protein
MRTLMKMQGATHTARCCVLLPAGADGRRREQPARGPMHGDRRRPRVDARRSTHERCTYVNRPRRPAPLGARVESHPMQKARRGDLVLHHR